MKIVWVVIFAAIGALLGWLAKSLFKGTKLLWDIIWGIVGSVGVPLLCGLFSFGAGVTAFSWTGIVMGIVGACVALLIYWLVKGRESNPG